MQPNSQNENMNLKFKLGKRISDELTHILASTKKIPYIYLLVIAVGLILAIALRFSMLDFKSIDFLHFTKGWYNTLRDQGFAAFRYGFYNYNPPYLYLLYLLIRFFPDMPAIITTKLPSLLSDFVCAWFAFKIVRINFPSGPLPVFAAFAVLFAPTVVLNSAVWGQADSIYTTALLASIYFLLKKQNVLAFVAFGISFAFKLQAVFLFPLLVALFLKGQVSWKHFLLIPLVMALALIPAWLAGRPLSDLLTIYLSQANTYGNNGELALNAPTFYTWLPQSHPIYDIFFPAGIVLALCIAFLFVFTIFEAKPNIVSHLLIQLALSTLLLMPFFLPKMHDRYFFPADVLSIIYVFYFPSYFFVPLIISTISFFAYQPFLFGWEPVPMPLLAFGMFVIICIVMRHTIRNLYFSEPISAEKANNILSD